MTTPASEHPDFKSGIEALAAWAERTNAIAEHLLKEQPLLNPITATIIAGDILSAERATAEVAAGKPAIEAYALVGSFARWDWVVSMVERNYIPLPWFKANICELWRGADPDDTNPDYLRLWKRTFADNGGSYLRDGRALPRTAYIEVFRGGHPQTVTSGFAWTTDPKIATKFARGAGERVPVNGGIVITGIVRREYVLAYITGRGESEVIVDPRRVEDLHQVGAKPA